MEVRKRPEKRMAALKPHKKMESMSTEVVLPLSLIESDILPRLPAKTIGRCMCVCKQWISFLSTPTFARMHLHNHNVSFNDYKLLLLDDQTPATFRTVDDSTNITCIPNPDPSSEFVLATLDGLVCLALRERSSELPPRDLSTQLAFWNPLTGAYKKLSSEIRFDYYMITSKGGMGFYIDSSNDYKLLCVIFGSISGEVYVYSNRLDSWRKIRIPIYFRCRPIWYPATFWGDCLYFVVWDWYNMVICFDVNKETFRKISFPPVIGDERNCHGSLAVLNGSIHLCVCDQFFKECNLWRMDGDDGWVKVAAFDHPLSNMCKREHICTTRKGDCVIVLEGNNYYSFNKMSAEDFIKHFCYSCSHSMEYWENNSRRLMYVETLVSPHL